MAKIPGYNDLQRVSPSVANDPGLRVPNLGASAEGLEKLSQKVSEVAIKADEDHDKSVAANLYAQTADKYRQWELEEGPASKKPSELFAPGNSVDSIYKGVESQIDKIGNEASGTLSGRQKEYFDTLWRTRRASELDQAATKIQTLNQTFRKDAIDRYWLGIDERTNDAANATELNWRGWLDNYKAIDSEFGNAAALGAPADEIARRKMKTQQAIAAGGVRGWFKEQPDRLIAAEQLYNGTIRDEDALKLYRTLDPKAREVLYRGLLEDSSKLITIENEQRRAQKEAAEKADFNSVKDFFMRDDLTTADRMDMLNRARQSPYISVDVVRKMDEFVRDGGRVVGLDEEPSVTSVERAIRADEVKTENDAILYVAKNNLKVSSKTWREKIMPMIQSRQDDRFSGALRWGQSTLGIISGSVLGDVFKDPVNKAAQFESELRDFYQKNPTGDLWAKAREITEKINTQGNAKAASNIPNAAAAYRSALAGGKPVDITNNRAALIAALVDAKMVDPLKAAASDFDPLKFIDTMQTPEKK